MIFGSSGFGAAGGVGVALLAGGGVPPGYALFLLRQADASYSTFQIKQADGSYRRFIMKVGA